MMQRFGWNSNLWRTTPFVLMLLSSLANSARANFIINGGFENVTGSETGQGLLPNNWVSVNSSPDTYSVDISYGLHPSDFNNFTGVLAIEGKRWVAGGAFGRTAGGAIGGAETFGQLLGNTLTPGQNYQLSAQIHQAVRADLNNPGGFDVFLASGNTLSGVSGAILLGTFAPTTNSSAWVARSFTFLAPIDAGLRSFIFFAPYQTSGTNAYPAIDVIALDTVVPTASAPAPASLVLLLSSLITFAAWRQFNMRRRAVLSI
jgi:hypothetical protein